MMSDLDPGRSQTAVRSALRVLRLIALPLLLILVLPLMRFHTHNFHLRTCLQKADGLRKGAPVRISGVEVGIVRDVRVRPEDHACPVMIAMELQTDYELKIPRDSRAYSSTEGLLGPAYVGIDSSNASGTPVENWGTLPGKVIPEFASEEFLNHLERLLQQSRPNKLSQSVSADSK